MRRATCSFCRRRGRNGWRWTRPMPRCNPSPRSGPCAPCAATSSRTTSSPAWGCIPWTTARRWLRAVGRPPRPVPMPLPARRRAWRPVHARPSAARARRATMRGRTSWAATACSTTPPWPRSGCATRARPAWPCWTWTTTTATARKASSTTARTCCSSASTATRAPNIRSTWVMPMKRARAPGRAATSTCRWRRAAACRRGSAPWRPPVCAFAPMAPMRWWSRSGSTPSKATRSRALPWPRRIFCAWGSAWRGWACPPCSCWRAAMPRPSWAPTR